MTRDIFNRQTYEPLTGSQRDLALLTTSPIGEEVARAYHKGAATSA